MIALLGVSKSFGRLRAVADASFEVPRGRVVGLLGSNGAGKTTTLRMIAGFMPPDAGRVTIDGLDTIDCSLEARRCVGYLPEASPAYGEMTVQDYLRFRGRLYGLRGRALTDATGRALGRCDLAEVARRRVGTLSRGFRQRVGLAAAILHDPPVLVLDEPTSALDPKQVRQARALIRDLARDKAVLVSSHVLGEVEQSCDEVVVLARGRVRARGTPTDLASRSGPGVGSGSGGACRVEVRAPADRVRALLSVVPGVAGVEALSHEDGWTRARVAFAMTADDPRPAIAAALSAVPLRELSREAIGFERAVLDIIESADA